MLTALLAALAAVPADFDATFTGRTLRLETYHAGDARQEHVALDRLRLEGEWPGSRSVLVDPLDFGKYRLRVRDAESGRLLYARGYCSIYGEWETTGEAGERWRVFHESLRFPEPRRAVTVAIDKRGEDGFFRELWRDEVDPASRFVDRSPLAPVGEVEVLRASGPSARKVDLLVVAEGYTAAERDEFRADVARLDAVMFATEPFRSRRDDFNVRTLFVAAAESGISNPRKGVWRDAPFGSSFNAFDSDRYVLTYDDRETRDWLAQAPYDTLLVVFNDRKYGGGGIYNLYATIAADTSVAAYVYVHEFGHSFAGLADEYYSSQVAYEQFNPPGVEPWEPNVTALVGGAPPKWADLIVAGVPCPTPWDKARYDAADLEYQAERKAMIERQASEEEAEALMQRVKERTAPLLAEERWYGRVGAFEGAMYAPRGLYRPQVDCIMFTRNPTTFCAVCRRALERVIDTYVR